MYFLCICSFFLDLIFGNIVSQALFVPISLNCILSEVENANLQFLTFNNTPYRIEQTVTHPNQRYCLLFTEVPIIKNGCKIFKRNRRLSLKSSIQLFYPKNADFNNPNWSFKALNYVPVTITQKENHTCNLAAHLDLLTTRNNHSVPLFLKNDTSFSLMTIAGISDRINSQQTILLANSVESNWMDNQIILNALENKKEGIGHKGLTPHDKPDKFLHSCAVLTSNSSGKCYQFKKRKFKVRNQIEIPNSKYRLLILDPVSIANEFTLLNKIFDLNSNQKLAILNLLIEDALALEISNDKALPKNMISVINKTINAPHYFTVNNNWLLTTKENALNMNSVSIEGREHQIINKKFSRLWNIALLNINPPCTTSSQPRENIFSKEALSKLDSISIPSEKALYNINVNTVDQQQYLLKQSDHLLKGEPIKSGTAIFTLDPTSGNIKSFVGIVTQRVSNKFNQLLLFDEQIEDWIDQTVTNPNAPFIHVPKPNIVYETIKQNDNTTKKEIDIRKGVYISRDGHELQYNFIHPNPTKKMPLLISLATAGGWYPMEWRYPQVEQKWQKEQGIFASAWVVIRGLNDYHFPSSQLDVQRAIQYFRKYADLFQIDPHKIAIISFCSGANIVSYEGLTDKLFSNEKCNILDGMNPQANATITLSAPLNFLPLEPNDNTLSGEDKYERVLKRLSRNNRNGIVYNYFRYIDADQLDFKDKLNRINEVAPHHYVNPNSSPFCFIYADDDPAIPPLHYSEITKALDPKSYLLRDPYTEIRRSLCSSQGTLERPH